MKLQKTIRIGSIVLPAGTKLSFSNEGYCQYKGKRLSKRAIKALESDEAMSDVDMQDEPTEAEGCMLVIKRSALRHLEALADIDLDFDVRDVDSKRAGILLHVVPTGRKAMLVCKWLIEHAGYDVNSIRHSSSTLAYNAKLCNDSCTQPIITHPNMYSKNSGETKPYTAGID